MFGSSSDHGEHGKPWLGPAVDHGVTWQTMIVSAQMQHDDQGVYTAWLEVCLNQHICNTELSE